MAERRTIASLEAQLYKAKSSFPFDTWGIVKIERELSERKKGLDYAIELKEIMF